MECLSELTVFVSQVFGRPPEQHSENPRVPQNSSKTTVLVHTLLSKALPEHLYPNTYPSHF